LNDDDPDAELLARVGRGEPRAVREMVERSSGACWRSPSACSAGAARPRKWRRKCSSASGSRRRTGSRAAPASTPGCTASPSTSATTGCAGAATRPGDDADEAAADRAGEPDALLQARQRGRRVARALAELPQRQREALVLQYYQERHNSEAAELMGIGIEALESLLVRARRSLRERLGGEPRRRR
jgi:RNA polymerase sigma-70 factor (ECF subfamily)